MSLTPKQEEFCRVYIETGNASEAYRAAYNTGRMKPTTINRNAKALIDNSKIATRLEELQKKHSEAHNFTVDRLLGMQMAAFALAMKGRVAGEVKQKGGKVVTLPGCNPSPAAATQITKNISTMLGLEAAIKHANTDSKGNDKPDKLEIEYIFKDADNKE